MQKVQTVTFAHSDTPVAKAMGTTPEPTYWTGGSTDTPLGQYLARPVRIAKYTWSLNSNFFDNIRPWQEWKNDASVRNRLEGYRHYRGKLRVRAVINGNPMYYGKVIMAWEPRAQRSMHPMASSTSNAAAVQLTCMPHVFLDATTGEGGELLLPFFCPENWLDTTNSFSTLDMGTLRFHSLAPLRTAGTSGTQSLEIQLYCWLEDAEVCTPTSLGYDQWAFQGVPSDQSDTSSDIARVPSRTRIYLGMLLRALKFWKPRSNAQTKVTETPQNEFAEEIPQNEFASGLVSKPASAVAKAASMLSKVPIFEPYALATEMVAKSIAGVAHIFGFSRPQVLDHVQKYRHFHLGDLCTTNTHDTFVKLAFDAKNQLTVDPRTVGLDPVDEMAIPYVVSKEAYCNKFDWSVTDVSDTTIQRINVSPVMFNRDTTTTTPRAAMTPMMFASMPFRYWRGSIILRFQIIASSFHRGRIRIAYDPAGSSTNPGYNEVYSTIVDIATNRDVEIPIEWHGTQPWLELHKPDIASLSDTPYSVTLPMDPILYNGQVTISVVNRLQAPDPTNTQPVVIAMYARGGDDLEFAVPYDLSAIYAIRAPDATEQPQSTFCEVAQNALETDQQESNDNMPEGGKPLGGMGDYHLSPKNDLTKVFFGESVVSLRTLLKRYVRESAVSGTLFHRNRRDMAANDTPLKEFIMSAYTGWRGTMRYKTAPASPTGRVTISHSYIGETSTGRSFQGVHVNYGPTEFETPWYSTKRFEHTRTNASFTDDTDERTVSNPNRHGFFHAASEGAFVYSAVGEDFTCFFFVGPPLIYST